MPAITIELDDDTLHRLRTAAEREGVSVDEIVTAATRQYVISWASGPKVDAVIADVISHYAPVLHRLAE